MTALANPAGVLARGVPGEATAPALSAVEVTRRYGTEGSAVDALKGVSIEVPMASFVAVMGPSGSGKSTLMHILAGLDSPTSGSVSVGGHDLTDLDDKELTLLRRDQIGFVFQSFNLLPMLTAEENVALPLQLAGRRPDRGWVAELIDRVGLTERSAHRPSQLSGGQQQRVAIARALVNSPTVLFADEPTGNLDSQSGQEVLAMIRECVDVHGQTTVMVTHDPRAAAAADRVVYLSDGLLVADLERPTETAVLEQMAEVLR